MSCVNEKVARIQHEIRLITNQLTEVRNQLSYSRTLFMLRNEITRFLQYFLAGENCKKTEETYEKTRF